MSLLSKVRMSPSEDKTIGDITEHERQRNQQAGSDAKAGKETHEPKGSWDNPELEQAADQTSAESLSHPRCGGTGLQTTRAGE